MIRVSNSAPTYMPNRIKNVYEKCTGMCKATLFTRAKHYLKCPSTETKNDRCIARKLTIIQPSKEP